MAKNRYEQELLDMVNNNEVRRQDAFDIFEKHLKDVSSNVLLQFAEHAWATHNTFTMEAILQSSEVCQKIVENEVDNMTPKLLSDIYFEATEYPRYVDGSVQDAKPILEAILNSDRAPEIVNTRKFSENLDAADKGVRGVIFKTEAGKAFSDKGILSSIKSTAKSFFKESKADDNKKSHAADLEVRDNNREKGGGSKGR